MCFFLTLLTEHESFFNRHWSISLEANQIQSGYGILSGLFKLSRNEEDFDIINDKQKRSQDWIYIFEICSKFGFACEKCENYYEMCREICVFSSVLCVIQSDYLMTVQCENRP